MTRAIVASTARLTYAECMRLERNGDSTLVVLSDRRPEVRLQTKDGWEKVDG